MKAENVAAAITLSSFVWETAVWNLGSVTVRFLSVYSWLPGYFNRYFYLSMCETLALSFFSLALGGNYFINYMPLIGH
jgi:hypothetical protein